MSDGRVKEYKVDFTPNPVQKQFIESRALADLFSSRAGEGKSTALCWSIFYHTQHNPGANWAVIRDTYENLQKSTLESFFSWFPPGIFGEYHATKKQFRWYEGVGRGTVSFVGIDDPQDASKLLSWELAGIAIDEPAPAVGNAGVDELVFDLGMTRLRQPNMQWYAMKLATNNPDESHWTFKKFVSPGIEGFRSWQPSAPENINNLPEGYYERMRKTLAHRPDLIRRFVDGEFGFQSEGKAVTPQWSDKLHLANGLAPLPRLELQLLYDFGHNPTCIITQRTPQGYWLILESFVGDGIGMQELIEDLVKPTLIAKYMNHPLWHIGDPAGTAGDQSSTMSSAVRVIKKELGGKWTSGPVRWHERVNPLQAVLTRTVGGRGVVQVDRFGAQEVWHALRGGYHYHVSRTGIPSAQPKKNMHCVDDKTEILTADGWKTWQTVNEGDVCYGYDPIEDQLRLDKVRKVNTFFGQHELERLRNSMFSAAATSEHKWFGRSKYGYVGPVRQADLNTSMQILVSAPGNRELAKRKPFLSDRFVRLCAWVMTEGSYGPNNRVTITQKTYEGEVRELLTPYEKVTEARAKNGAVTFRIGGETALLIRAMMPEKFPNGRLIALMTAAQKRLFLYECMRGDGTTRGEWPTKTRQIGRARNMWEGADVWRLALQPRQADAVQHIATLLGLRTIARDKGHYTLLTIAKRGPWVSVDKLQREKLKADMVWCPTTESGYWMARRDGIVFLTGNSHPGDAMGYGAAVLFPMGRVDRREGSVTAPREPGYWGGRSISELPGFRIGPRGPISQLPNHGDPLREGHVVETMKTGAGEYQ